MTLRDFILKYYRGRVKPLEAYMISEAVKERQWNDFNHTWKERVVFTLISFLLK